MIYEITEHPDVTPEYALVEQLANIDLLTDVVICFNPLQANNTFHRVVSDDIDQFAISNHEAYKSIAMHSTLVFNTFPRVKISLPNGLVPDFTPMISGLNIRNIEFDKMQGIELDQSLEIPNVQVDLKAETGRYSFYHNIKISYSVFDQALFSKNKMIGNSIPINTNLCNLRLLPHFLGVNLCDVKLNNIYIICSKYIYSRLPNF